MNPLNNFSRTRVGRLYPAALFMVMGFHLSSCDFLADIMGLQVEDPSPTVWEQMAGEVYVLIQPNMAFTRTSGGPTPLCNSGIIRLVSPSTSSKNNFYNYYIHVDSTADQPNQCIISYDGLSSTDIMTPSGADNLADPIENFTLISDTDESLKLSKTPATYTHAPIPERAGWFTQTLSVESEGHSEVFVLVPIEDFDASEESIFDLAIDISNQD
jgi:hypothetical protein